MNRTHWRIQIQHTQLMSENWNWTAKLIERNLNVNDKILLNQNKSTLL